MESTRKPVAKVTAGALGGSVATLVVFAAGLFGAEIPAEVGAALATVVGFAAGYLKSA